MSELHSQLNDSKTLTFEATKSETKEKQLSESGQSLQAPLQMTSSQVQTKEQQKEAAPKKKKLEEKDYAIPVLKRKLDLAEESFHTSQERLADAMKESPKELEKIGALREKLDGLLNKARTTQESDIEKEGEKLDRMRVLLDQTSDILELILTLASEETEESRILFQTAMESDFFGPMEPEGEALSQIRDQEFRMDMVRARLTVSRYDEETEAPEYDETLEKAILEHSLLSKFDDSLPVKLPGRKTGGAAIRIGHSMISVRGFEEKKEGEDKDTPAMQVAMTRISLDSDPIGRLLFQRNTLVSREEERDKQEERYETLRSDYLRKKSTLPPEEAKKQRDQYLAEGAKAYDMIDGIDRDYSEYEKALLKKSGAMIERLQGLMNGLLNNWDQSNADEVYTRLADLSHKMAQIAMQAGVLVGRRKRKHYTEEMEQELLSGLDMAFSEFEKNCPDASSLTFGDEAFEQVERCMEAAGDTLQYTKRRAEDTTGLTLGSPYAYRLLIGSRKHLLRDPDDPQLQKRVNLFSAYVEAEKKEGEDFDPYVEAKEERRYYNTSDMEARKRKLLSGREANSQTKELWDKEVDARIRLEEERAELERQEAERRRLEEEQRRLEAERLEQERLAEIERHKSVVSTLTNGLSVKTPTEILGRIDAFTDADGVRVEKVGKVTTFKEKIFGISASKINERMDKHVRRLLASDRVTDLHVVQTAEAVVDGSGLFSDKFLKLCQKNGIAVDLQQKTFPEQGDFALVAKRLNLLHRLDTAKTTEETNPENAEEAKGELLDLMNRAHDMIPNAEAGELPYNHEYYTQYPNAGKTIMMYKLLRGIELSSLPEGKFKTEMQLRIRAAEENLGRLYRKVRESNTYQTALNNHRLAVNQAEVDRSAARIHELDTTIHFMDETEIAETEASFYQRWDELMKKEAEMRIAVSDQKADAIRVTKMAKSARMGRQGSNERDRVRFRKVLRGYTGNLREKRIRNLASPKTKYVADQTVRLNEAADHMLRREITRRFSVEGKAADDLFEQIKVRIGVERPGGIRDVSEIGKLSPEQLRGFMSLMEQRLLPFEEGLNDPQFAAWKENLDFRYLCQGHLLAAERTDLREFRLFAEKTMAELGERSRLVKMADEVFVLGKAYVSRHAYVDVEKQRVNTKLFSKEKELRAVNRIARMREAEGLEADHSAVLLAMIGDQVNTLKLEDYEKVLTEKKVLFFQRRQFCEDKIRENHPTISPEAKEELLTNLDRYMTITEETQYEAKVGALIGSCFGPQNEELRRLAKRKDERLTELTTAASGIFSPLIPLLVETKEIREALVADGEETYEIKKNRLIERLKPVMELLCERDSLYLSYLDQYLIGYLPRILPGVFREKMPETLAPLQTKEGAKAALDQYYVEFSTWNLNPDGTAVTIDSELRKLTSSSKEKDQKRAMLKTQVMRYHGVAGIFDQKRLAAYQDLYAANVDVLETELKNYFSENPELAPSVQEAIRASAFLGERDELFRLETNTYRQYVRDHVEKYAELQQTEAEIAATHMEEVKDSLTTVMAMLEDKKKGREALVGYRKECQKFREFAKTGVSPLLSFTESQSFTEDTRDWEKDTYKRLERAAKEASLDIPDPAVFKAATEMLQFPSVAGRRTDTELLQHCTALYNVILKEEPTHPALQAEYLHSVMGGISVEEARENMAKFQRYRSLSDKQKDEKYERNSTMAELMDRLIAYKDELPDNGILQGLYRDILMRSLYESAYPNRGSGTERVWVNTEIMRRALMLYHCAEDAMDRVSVPEEERNELFAGIFDYFGDRITANMVESERLVPEETADRIEALLKEPLFRKYIKADKDDLNAGIGNSEHGQIVAMDTASFAGQKTRHSFELHLFEAYGSDRAVKEYQRLSEEEKLIAGHLILGEGKVSEDRYSLSMSMVKSVDAQATVSESRSALIMRLINQKQPLAEPDYDLVESQLFTDGLISKEKLDTDKLMGAIRLAKQVTLLRENSDFKVTEEEYEKLIGEEEEEKPLTEEEKTALLQRIPTLKQTIERFENGLKVTPQLNDEERMMRYSACLHVWEKDMEDYLRTFPEGEDAALISAYYTKLLDLETYEHESEEGKRLIESNFYFTAKDPLQVREKDPFLLPADRRADEENYEEEIREKVGIIERFLSAELSKNTDSTGFVSGLEILERPLRERLFIYHLIETGSYEDPKKLDAPVSQNFYVPDPEAFIKKFLKIEDPGAALTRNLSLLKNPEKGVGRLLMAIEQGRLVMFNEQATEEERNRQATYLAFLKEVQKLDALKKEAEGSVFKRDQKRKAVRLQQEIVDDYLELLGADHKNV